VSKKLNVKKQNNSLSRRSFITGSAAIAAVASSAVIGNSAEQVPYSAGKRQRKKVAHRAPFETFRDYITAMEDHGTVLRFDRVDQDAYEGTAIMYRLIDQYGMYEAPIVIFEEIKINGRWVKGPLVCNHQGHWDTEAITFGLDPVENNGEATYRKALAHFEAMLKKTGGSYPQIPPVTIPRDRALCKEVVLQGDDIDLTRFAFIKGNPGDVGRYINTGSIFTSDPEMGVNIGTYRCQLKGPRKIAINSETKQTGWKMLMAAKNRGEKIARISVIIGQEPVLWMVGSTRVAGRRGPKPVDELAIAGGLRNKALEVIKCETNDLLVPAHSEMVIEGEVPLDKLEPEGPYHEMYGYMGQPKNEQFYMNVTTVTHRKDPWLANNFTGFTPAYVRAPGTARSLMFMKMFNPFVVDLYTRNDATGFFFISIDKTEPGQAMKVGKAIAQRVPIAKVVIIVDKDIDVMKASDIWLAMGTRWQPFSASHLIESSPTIALDPSSKDRSTSSKIVIDATRQLPEEGGPDIFPELSRALLEQGAPDAFARVDAKWGDVIIRQRRF